MKLNLDNGLLLFLLNKKYLKKKSFYLICIIPCYKKYKIRIIINRNTINNVGNNWISVIPTN